MLVYRELRELGKSRASRTSLDAKFRDFIIVFFGITHGWTKAAGRFYILDVIITC